MKTFSVCLLFCAFLLNSCGQREQNYVDARELAIFSVYLQAVDAESDQPINVKVSQPPPELSKFLRTARGAKAAPSMTEFSGTKGLVRITWIDLATSELLTITISADGYEDRQIPQEWVDKCSGTRAGRMKLRVLKLARSEQPAAEDAEDAAPEP